MILPKYLEGEVKKFCEISNILIVDGKVPPQHELEIKDFIIERMKKDRKITRRAEENKKLHIGSTLEKIMYGKEPDITIEDYMKDALVRADLFKDCVPQYEIGTKRVDFAFPKSRLALECDGKAYHFTEAWQIERDQKRDKYLARKGWRVLHIEGLAIRRNIALCIDKIREAL